MKCLDEKLKIFPESVYLLHQKGHAPYKIEKHEEALKYSDKIPEANPQYIPALYTKISCLEEIMKNKDIYEKSIRHRLW